MTMFQLELEAELTHAFFFKGKQVEDKESDKEMDEDDYINKPKGLMKKNYLLISKDGNIIIKGLTVRKKSCSPLTRKIFWDYLVPKIKTEYIVQFSKAYLQNLITELLEKDISLATLRKSVNPFAYYEQTSPTGLPAQIAKKYGAGIHFLIPNLRKLGVGKGKNYCTLEEFKEKNLNISDIDLSNVWQELVYFTKPVVVKNIFDF